MPFDEVSKRQLHRSSCGFWTIQNNLESTRENWLKRRENEISHTSRIIAVGGGGGGKGLGGGSFGGSHGFQRDLRGSIFADRWPVLNTNVAILKLPAAGFLTLLGKLPLLCATRQSCETCERFAQLKTNSDPGRHRPYQFGSKWRPWYSSSQWWNLPHGVPLEQTVAPAFSEEQSELFRVCTVIYFLSLPSSPNHTRWEPDTLVGRHAYSLIKRR